MVIGSTSSTQAAHVVHVAGDGAACAPVADFPAALFGAVGTFIGGRPLVCGGYFATDCYEHRKEASDL